MSYAQTRSEYGGGYPQYSEADILDFITNGSGDGDHDVAFSTLEGAEDMIFSGFASGDYSGFHGGLSDSTDHGITVKLGDSSDGFLGVPVSHHSAFISQHSVGVGSYNDPNARSRLEQLQHKQEHPVTPLRDTPHTPTNVEYDRGVAAVPRTGFAGAAAAMSNQQHARNGAPGAAVRGGGVAGARGFGTAHVVPSVVRGPALHQVPQGSNALRTNLNHLAVTSEEEGAEPESTELREFLAPGSLETVSLLNEVQANIQVMQQQIDEMRTNQTATLQALCENLVSEQTENTPHLNALQEMIDVQSEWLKTAADMQNSIFELQKSMVLASHEVDRSTSLSDELGFIISNIALMIQELTAYLSWVKDGGDVPTLDKLVSLVISKAPFPSIWMKRNQMSEAEAIYAKLIHGCSVTLSTVSEVKATIHCHTAYTAKTTPAKPIIDFDNFPMDPATLVAACQFVFTAGSRKDVAQCRFAMSVEGSSFATTVLLNRGNEVPPQDLVQVVSPDSKPFIVITNECQYGETFGILFQKDVFHHQWGEAQSEIPWPLFANSIQRYFIRSSRQDPVSPKRGLSVYDLEHIQAHFFASSPLVDLKSSQKFWDWYGKVLHRLRYQRHVAALWMEGLIFGMVSREGVCEQLISRQPGTFLLRFSESSAGFIAVGYRVSGANAGIKNYLVKQEDTASATVKTLPDFLRSRPEFSVLLQYTGQHLEDGFPILYPIHKDYALKAYCAARPPKLVDPKAGSPYDEL
jgi:hypothetical protein